MTAGGDKMLAAWCQITWLLLAGLVAILEGVVACRGRQVYNDTAGVITDGDGDYPESAHCEWLIIGKFTGL